LATWIQESRHEPMDACSRALERNPRCFESWVLKAEILEAAGHRDDAFASYAEAYRLEPEDKIVLSRLKILAGQMLRPMPDPGPVVKAQDRKNHWSKAETEMENGSWKKAFSTVKNMPFRYDRDFKRPFLIRMAEEAKGDGEVLRWADSLAHTIPREGTLIYAAALKGAGRFSSADELLREQAEAWPLDPFPCERLGQLRKGLKLWSGAAKAYEDANRRDWRGRWIIEEARCLAENGDWGSAAKLYVEELQRKPFQPEAYKGLMTAYEKNSRPHDALTAARLWSQADPLSKEAWEAYRRLLKGSDSAMDEGIARILKEL
jgi:tetratricopeptide (TPR) repeat protein